VKRRQCRILSWLIPQLWMFMMSGCAKVYDGLRYYAIRQAQMYRQLAEDARSRFITVNLIFSHHNL
jgi:hypothetical protein